MSAGNIQRTALAKYKGQIQGAKHRGIEWGFTFETWWAVWEASGKWDQRGRKSDQYAMGRFGDVGPYAPGNVEIITSAQNARDRNARVGVPAKQPGMARMGRAAQGWVYHRKTKARPYEAVLCRKSLGSFATPEEAREVYLKAAALLRAEREAA